MTSEPRVGRRERAGGAAIVLLLVALFHGPSLRAGFVYDDAWTVVGNAFIREPANLLRLLGPGPARELVPDAGRPVLLATEIVDHALWGLSPRGFHLQNLLWHGGVAVLLFLGLGGLIGGFLLPFTAAALFAVHPLHAEAVAAVNYREDLLAAFFVLAALLVLGAARRRGQGRGGARVAAFALALLAVLSKENAMVAPILLVVLELCFPPADRRPGPRVLDVLALAGAAAAGFAWRAWVMGGAAVVSRSAEIPHDHQPLLAAVPRGALAFAQGVGQLVVPIGLSPEYPEPGPMAVAAGFGALALMATAVVLALRARRRQPVLALAVLGGVAAYLPTLGLVPITNLRADRYLYLPSLALLPGLAALVVAALGRLAWARRAPLFDLPRPVLAVGALALVLGFLTLRQARVWRDDLTLWTHATAAAPGSARAWTALAEARLRRGLTMSALEAVRRALALSDRDGHARALHGIILMQQGDLPAARAELAQALAGAEEHHRAERLNNLGYCELQMGLVDEALARFEEARRLDPGYDRPYLNAARALERRGELDAARALIEALLARVPDSDEGRRELARLRGP